MKDQPSNSIVGAIPNVGVDETGDYDQLMVALLDEHFPELNPEHFLRWSRVALKELWEAQRRVFN